MNEVMLQFKSPVEIELIEVYIEVAENAISFTNKLTD